MIQVIDYQNGLVGIRAINAYNSLKLKIGSAMFELDRSELTLSELPTKIFKRYTVPSKIDHYIDENNYSLTVNDYNTAIRQLKSFGYEDDNDNFIWETREDKENYDKFRASWKPVYSEEVIGWEPVQFEIVKKQHIPDKYKGWIESSIIIESMPSERVYKAICTYTSNPTNMIREIAAELGFEIVTDENRTTGMKLFIYHIRDSVLRFSKVNGNYFKIPEDIWKQYRNKSGTLEECIAKFDWEWKQIHDYLRGVSNVINNKGIDYSERAHLVELIDESIRHYRSIDSMKSTRESYRSLGNVLNVLKRKLTLLD